MSRLLKILLAALLYVLPLTCGNAMGADSTSIVYDPALTQAEADLLVDRLFIQASSGEVMFRDLVQPSKDSIAALGAKALPRMLSRLTARDARERWTISEIFEKIGSVATDSLLSYLGSEDEYVLLNIGRCLGRIKDTSSTMPCLPMLEHQKYPVRSEFASTLGKNQDPRAVPALIIRLQADTVDDVRKSAAVAQGRIADTLAIRPLIAALDDPYFGVRKCASGALLKFSPVPILEIAEAVERLDGVGRGTAMETLGKSQDKRAEKLLKYYLQSPEPLLRGYAIDALADLDTKGARRALRKFKADTEPDFFVRSRLRAALARLGGGN